MRRVENGLIQDWVTLRRNENSWKEGRNRRTESAVSVYQLGTVFSNYILFFLDASFIAHTTHTHTHTHKVNVIHPYPEEYCLGFFKRVAQERTGTE